MSTPCDNGPETRTGEGVAEILNEVGLIPALLSRLGRDDLPENECCMISGILANLACHGGCIPFTRLLRPLNCLPDVSEWPQGDFGTERCNNGSPIAFVTATDDAGDGEHYALFV